MTKEKSIADLANELPDTPAAPTPEWFLMDGVPGQGPRPDWLLSNFNNAAEQAKAYPSLRKTLGAQQGAPEQYEFGELAKELDLDNQALKEFQIYAKENRLSQEAFKKTMETYVEIERSKRPDVDKEIAKLGPNGIEKVKTVQNWAKNNLTPESYKAFEYIPVRAEFINMLDEVRQRGVHAQTKVPGSTEAAPEFKLRTLPEIHEEIYQNRTRYYEDASYRTKMQQEISQVVGEE